MRKFFKYLGRIILAITGLLLILMILLYLPPVQNLIRKKAVAYVSGHYGLVVKLDHFRLGFPLDVTMQGVYLGRTETDTLIAAERLTLRVGLKRILRKELSVNELSLQQARLGIRNDTTGMAMDVRLGELSLQARTVDLSRRFAEIGEVKLAEGEVVLNTGKTSEPDTTAGKSLDWTFSVGEIELEKISYRMSSVSMPYLGAGIGRGKLSEGKVELGRQEVNVGAVEVGGAWCRIQTAREEEKGQTETTADTDTVSEAWTVRAGTLALANSYFGMGKAGEANDKELVLSGIAVRVDSVYNRGTVVKAALKDLRAVQKNGIELTGMHANIDLDTALTALNGAYIRTTNSQLWLNVQSDTSVQHLMQQMPLYATLRGQVGMADVLPFYADIPAAVRDKSLRVNTSFTLTDKRIQVGQLILAMPGYFRVSGSGRLSNFRDIKKMYGNFDLRGELPDVTFARTYLGEQGIRIPRNMDMLAHLKASRGKLESLLRLCCGDGCLTLDGSYRIEPEIYDGELTLNNFPLNQFMPGDSLGRVTAVARFEGEHYSWAQAKAGVFLGIQQFFYNGHNYNQITVRAGLDKTRLQGSITSEDPDVPLDLIFKGDSVGQAYVAKMSGLIGPADLQALHFAQEPFRLRSVLDLEAWAAKDKVYGIRLHLDSLEITDARQRYALGNLVLNMDSDLRETTLDMLSGDMKLHFSSDTSLMAFAGSVGKVAKVVQQQVADRDVNMEVVRQELPVFALQIEGARQNAVTRFLNSRNIGFRSMMLDVVSRKRSGLRVGFQANAPYFGGVRLDSVQLGAWQTGKSLVYSMNAGSSDEAWKGLFNMNIAGRVQGDRLRLELKQKDADGQVGFDLGVNLIMGDTAFTVSFFPMNPILGYGRWMVNADNRITVGKDWSVNANLRMAYMNKLVNIQSLGNEGGQQNRLKMEIAGVELQELSRMVPFMPDLKGELNTDVLLYSQDSMLGVNGTIQVAGLYYENQRIGTVDLDMQYTAANRLAKHVVDFELKIDSIRRAVVKGAFSTSKNDRDLMVDVNFPGFPLYVANAFLPADVMQLNGTLTGGMQLRGTIDKPQIDGELAFRDTKADVVMIGTTFSLDERPLVVENGRIVFDRYRFIAPNNSDMILNGAIVLTPFDQMSMDLTVDADNFEVVNVRKNNTSLIYGKAYADIDAAIRGEFANLSMTGNVNLLNTTNITYTLRSSGPRLADHSVDLVRFVSFRDTTLNEQDELTNRVKTGSFSLRMMIEIGSQVTVGVDLSEDGSNHITILGGGNLVLGMNPESGMNLSGKYILSGGTVVYNIPIAGKKEFSIRTGSYVEWTGNVMNPQLNISASESVKATVEDGERNRLVTFDAIIRIQNTLSRPDISFDLSAPNDMVIQNQLATFSQEERTRQALNLLIYNTYTAPGAAKSGTGGNVANNAVFGFVENEVNKYTRKVGLTVGVESYNTDENTVQRDVTYQFSKQLFNDRIRVKVGGRISADGNENQSNNSLQDNLVDDVSIEYDFTRRRNLFLRIFRHSNYESVLDGEVVQTGVGIVWRKEFRKFKDLFKNKNRQERRMEKKKRETQ